MATYDSIHTGEQVDAAVDIVLNNKNKGSNVQPIYLDANGEAKNVNIDAAPTQDSQNLIQSGGVFTQLSTKYAKVDISTDENLGTSNVLIPSQGAVKTYVDTHLATKQNVITAGDGIIKDGNTLKINGDNNFMTTGKLGNKWSHFATGLDMGYGTEIIEKMEKAKKSSFGRDKFTKTVNWSGTITDDGIASGFNSSSALKPTYDFNNAATAGSWEVDCAILYKTVSANQAIFTTTGDNFTNLVLKSSGKLGVDIRDGIPVVNVSGDTTLTANTFYFIKFIFTGTQYQIWLSTDGVTYELDGSANSSARFKAQGTWHIGCAPGMGQWAVPFTYGSIDLKQFSITVDGEEVFNGNKTGVDTLKTDNYSVVNNGKILYAYTYSTNVIYSNSPTAPTKLYNADGTMYTGTDFTVANNVISYNGSTCTYDSTSNVTLYLNINDAGIAHIPPSGSDFIRFYNVENDWVSHDWDLFLPFTVTPELKNNRSTQPWIYSMGDICLTQWYSTGNMTAYLRQLNNGTRSVISVSQTNFVADVGDNVVVRLTHRLSEKRVYMIVYVNGIQYRNATYLTYSGELTFDGEKWIATDHSGFYEEGYINYDLNQLKFYVDGQLVYQPCLKIPYTQTKDGKKIVDDVYRNRVEGAYTQAGYSPYYTLNSSNPKNFIANGTPNISDDWIASGFNNGYVVTGYSLPIDKDFTLNIEYEITQEFLTKYNNNDTQYFLGTTYNPSNDQVPVVGEHMGHNYRMTKFTLRLDNNGTIQILQLYTSSFDVALGDKIQVILSRANGQYKIQSFKNDVLVGEYTATTSNNILFETDLIIGQYKSNWPGSTFGGAVDLKTFEVSVENEMAYKAIMPPNYTMATVKESAIVDSYDNGVNKWTKYANLDLSQQGSCTSGTAVTFAKPFRDANYVLSVPYTSGTKTATGFTPSFTDNCDYIAKGKCNLNFPQE